MSRQHDREALVAQRKTSKQPTSKPPTTSPKADSDDLRSAVGNSGMGRLLDPSVTDTIEAELGGGRPLAAAAERQGSAAGPGSSVRLHDDGTAAELSRELGAVAFTFGRDIFLSGSAPDLDSSDGQAMLRHELTHVDQQAAGATARPRRVSSPDSPAEQQATRVQHGDAAAGANHAAASAVHRQEELPDEEELQMMAADTVHRQEELPDEEELQMMAADTVHRQEELPDEEELQMMAADTVHRHVPGPEEEAGTPAPANPALAALFDATVLRRHREALEAVTAEPADTAAALAAVVNAWEGVSAVSATYEGSDPLLFNSLRRYQNALNVAMQKLNSIEDGPASTESVSAVLSHEQVMGLGEQLRDQLH